MVILSGHTSAETAFLVADYPYGFRLRCKIRYWLEHNKNGSRFWNQTTNPKRPGEVWNKPKASTYAYIAGAMFQSEQGHVSWSGMTEYQSLDECKRWLEIYQEGLPEEVLKRACAWIGAKEKYEEIKAAKPQAQQQATTLTMLPG